MTKNVAVVGAGVTGITTAYYLAKKGHKVTVFEQEPYPAMRTSYANGGQISVSNSEVWTTWSNIQKGIKWIFTKDAPLLIKPRLDLAQWLWLAKFLKHTIAGDYIQNTSETIDFGLKARELYNEICNSENIEHNMFDRTDSGILHFYKDKSYWTKAQEATTLYHYNGVDRNVVDMQQMQNIDPALSDIKNVIGATFTPSDWTGDIHKFTYLLADILEKSYGVCFKYNSKTSMKDILDNVDSVIICAGVGSVELAKQVGDKLDIYPVKGYSITINNVDPKLLPKVSLLDDQAKIVTSTLGNRFRVAGTAELAGENYDIRQDRIKPLLNWVHTNFPKINTHDYSSWACLRPMTPNMMPITKQSDKNSKVYYNTGHGHLGWTLAPYTAKLISDQI